MTGVPTSSPTGAMPSSWLARSASSYSCRLGRVGQFDRQSGVDQGRLEQCPAALLPAEMDAGAEGGVQRPQHVIAVLLLGGDRHPDGTPVFARPSRYFSGRLSRPSLSTDRLITWKRMSTGRTFSTSSNQRDVSQAHGQAGSNHMSAVMRSVTIDSSSQLRMALTLLTEHYPAAGWDDAVLT